MMRLQIQNYFTVCLEKTEIIAQCAVAATKELFDELTEGWTEQIIDDGIKKITVRTSPDNLYSLNFRTFYTSSLMDTVESVDATIDVIPNSKEAQELINSSKGVEIKFGTLK